MYMEVYAVQHVWAWHPPVGVWIGVLGFLGILVPLIRDLGKIGKVEKAVWTFVMFALLLLEIKSVYQDRNEHDQQEREAREREENNFRTIANGITDSITESQNQFKATMAGISNTLKASNATVQNTRPRAALEWQAMIPAGPSFSIPSPIMRFDVFYTNYGNDVARMVRNGAKIYIRKPDDAAAAREIVNDFNMQWEKLNLSPAVDVNPNAPRFFMFTKDDLTEEESKGILNRTLTMYVVIRFTWSDNTGEWTGDECFSYQDPAHDLRIGHPCQIQLNPRYRRTERRP